MATRLIRNARMSSGELVDLVIEGPVIAEIVPAGMSSVIDGPVDDVDSALVVPSLVDVHVHLDKTFLGGPWQPHASADSILGRIEVEHRIRERLADGAAERAIALAESMIASGTGALRTHVDVDPDWGLENVRIALAVRGAVRDRADVQIVAFPQSGIVRAPGTIELLREAVSLGADVIGGLDPVDIDGDAESHLDAVFALAAETGSLVDLHLHATGDTAAREFELIFAAVDRYGMQQRTALSHAFGLATSMPDEFERMSARIAERGISIVTNGPSSHLPPIAALRTAGVNVAVGSDNVRDAWWPFGRGDVLDVLSRVAFLSDLRTDEELAQAFELVSVNAAEVLGMAPPSLTVGSRADLLAAPVSGIAELVAAPPAERHVMRAGEWISRTHVERTTIDAALSQRF